MLRSLSTSFCSNLTWWIPFDNPVIDVREFPGDFFSWSRMDGCGTQGAERRMRAVAACCYLAFSHKSCSLTGLDGTRSLWWWWWWPESTGLCSASTLLLSHKQHHHHHHHHHEHCGFADKSKKGKTGSSTLPSASSTCLRRRYPRE